MCACRSQDSTTRRSIPVTLASGAVFERFHLAINLCRRYERVLMAVNDCATTRKHFSRFLVSYSSTRKGSFSAA